ncbi:MAG: prepilin-type N-terminal cleavage/methylation domain-containing protein [Azonexus sp.]|jgi:prepilin-type N-terminal cleavage/methylation domain-containing protein|nr:prepilin-type N-terminal cleavage/methylation domain-containing protein [Azonexus sp.]
MKSHQKGFTLVEIAIVLVIIGLLLGGVLKGQELINSAKVKNLANDFRSVPTFVYAYQDKFRALPGDDRAAQAHVNGTANGDGSGRIDGDWNAEPAAGGGGGGAACGTESCNFWDHVRRANLATGTLTPGAEFFPRNSEGGLVGITGVTPIAGWTGNFYVCSTNIQGRFVRQLDITMDDGNTTTGNLRIICQGVCATAASPLPGNLTTAEDSNLYTVCSSS